MSKSIVLYIVEFGREFCGFRICTIVCGEVSERFNELNVIEISLMSVLCGL